MTDPRWMTGIKANTRRQMLPEPNWLVVWVLAAVTVVLMVLGLAVDLGYMAQYGDVPYRTQAAVFGAAMLVFHQDERLFVVYPLT